VRTVGRWEKERGLPVRRLPGRKTGGAVFAYTGEIDSWLAGRPSLDDDADALEPAASDVPVTPDTIKRRRRGWQTLAIVILLPVGGVVATRAGLSFRHHAAGRITGVSFAGNEMRALDSEGLPLWSHRFDRHVVNLPGYLQTTITARPDELLIVVPFVSDSGIERYDELFCFSSDGAVRWHLAPQDRVTFAEREFGPPWASDALLAYGPPGRRVVAWSLHHHTWWPALVVNVSSDGQIV